MKSKIFEENLVENLTFLIPTYIDPLIEGEFSKTIEVPVIVKIKDTSRIKVTSKDSLELQEFKDRTKKEILENKTKVVLNSLLPSEFKLKDTFLMGNGFYGNITKEGFHKLQTNPDIYRITLDRYISVKLVESRVMVNASSVNSDGYNGTHQTACVIDSGIDYTHPALGGCFGATCKVRGGWNYDNNSGIPMDNANHGTIVAGIIASEHPEVRGIAPAARLVALRVCDDSGKLCSISNTEQALQYCYNNRNIYNISVVSLSLGEGEYTNSSCPTDAATEINDLHAVGIPIIAVSGNEHYTNGINWPACRSNATSVGAVYDGNFGFQIYDICTDLTTGSDVITCFTNRKVGLLDLLAPGCRVNSTNQGALNFSYECGTSFAGPMVVGAVALLKQLNKSLTADEIENTLKNTGVTIGDYKRINILAALNAIRDKDNDNYYDQAYGGNDCNDNNAAVNPGATEVCDDIDNDCDGTTDEGCVEDCSVSGYEQCAYYTFGDCNASIAVNYYANVNNIRWGAVNDSNDPYVISEYRVGWKGVRAKNRYYGVTDPSNDCGYSGCSTGGTISNTGTKVTVTAPGTATTGNLLAHNNTASYWCTVWFNGFNPNYGSSNPIFVLNCFTDSDCASGSFCNKTGTWNQWACVTKYANGVQCAQDSQCQSNYCDNDGLGLTDDTWCFTPYNTYFDGQENTYCEYSTDNGIADCDERLVGDDLNRCVGTSYYEDECGNSCTYQDITSVFECTETGCSCSQPLCDGLTTGSSITACSSNKTYFADKCTSIASGEDRGDNICRSSAFNSGCTADTQCNGVTAGANTENGGCGMTCNFDAFPNVTLISPLNNNVSTTKNILFNCSATDDYKLVNITLYHNISGTWKFNETKNLSNTSDFEAFETNNTPNGNFIWNCLAYDNASLSGWGNTNYSIKVNVTQQIPNLTITSLQNIYSNSTLRIFEFVVLNDGETAVTDVQWQFDAGDGNVMNSTINMSSLAVNERAFVYIEYNYSSSGSFNVKANATGLSQSTTITASLSSTVTVGNATSLNVYDFSVLYQNFTLVVFGFSVNNTGTVNLSNINWSLNTWSETITANELFGLKPNESIFVFAEYQYPTGGEFNVIASATDGTNSDSESLPVNVKAMEVSNLSVLNISGTKAIFEFIIGNRLSTNLTNVSWAFDTRNSNVINSTMTTILQPSEQMFVYIEYNFTTTGTFNVNASARNGSLSDYRNLTITVT